MRQGDEFWFMLPCKLVGGPYDGEIRQPRSTGIVFEEPIGQCDPWSGSIDPKTKIEVRTIRYEMRRQKNRKPVVEIQTDGSLLRLYDFQP